MHLHLHYALTPTRTESCPRLRVSPRPRNHDTLPHTSSHTGLNLGRRRAQVTSAYNRQQACRNNYTMRAAFTFTFRRPL